MKNSLVPCYHASCICFFLLFPLVLGWNLRIKVEILVSFLGWGELFGADLVLGWSWIFLMPFCLFSSFFKKNCITLSLSLSLGIGCFYLFNGRLFMGLTVHSQSPIRVSYTYWNLSFFFYARLLGLAVISASDFARGVHPDILAGNSASLFFMLGICFLCFAYFESATSFSFFIFEKK